MREETRRISQNPSRAQETPLFMRLDGQEGFEHGRDSMRQRERREMAALSLQGITEARRSPFAVAERV